MATSEYIFCKPDRHIFELDLRKVGLVADEVWYCGNDIVGAYEAGLFPLFYDDRSVPSAVYEKNDKIKPNFSYRKISSWNELFAWVAL